MSGASSRADVLGRRGPPARRSGRRWFPPAVLAVLMAFGAACGGGDNGFDIDLGDEESGSSVELRSRPSADPAGTGSGSSRAGGEEEDFDEEVSAVAGLAERYWTELFVGIGARFEPVSEFASYGAGGTTCSGSEVPPQNAVYCAGEDFIAFDYEWLRELYEDTGDGAVWLVLPHEWAHAAQARLGRQYRFSIEVELQADCYAGAFVGWALETGAVVEEPGDAEEMFGNLAAVADPTDEWWRPGAHGTVEQRQGAFANGIRRGAGAC